MGIFSKLKEKRKAKLKSKGKDQNSDGLKDGGILDKLVNKLNVYAVGMKMILAQKGITVPKNIPILELSILFAEKVLNIDVRAIRENIRFGKFEGRGGYVVGEFAAATIAAITAIVQGVASFFIQMKKKKDKGDLPDNQAKAVEKVEEAIDAVGDGVGGAIVGDDAKGIPLGLANATPLLIILGVYLLAKNMN